MVYLTSIRRVSDKFAVFRAAVLVKCMYYCMNSESLALILSNGSCMKIEVKELKNG